MHRKDLPGNQSHVAFWVCLLGMLAASGNVALGQILMGGADQVVRLHNSDLAIFEAGESRDDLPCTVTSERAFLGFDLRFHSGFETRIPLAELAGNENLLTILFRVIPLGEGSLPTYFLQRIRVPSIEEEAKGDAVLQGGFDVGEGRYRVDWLMRDRSERVCSSSWEVEAVLPAKDHGMALRIAPNRADAMVSEQFREDPPIARDASDPPIKVKVLVNFAPQKASAATLRPIDTIALVSILRAISREPKFGNFSLVAFNLQEQRVVFRQDNAEKIDFPALGEALSSINPGAIDLKLLAEKDGATQFLGSLVAKEFDWQGKAKPDAMIFAGPKALVDTRVPEEDLKKVRDPGLPVFYMNYNLYPQVNPWRDAIGQMVRALKGYEYTISRPRDMWHAVSDAVSRIVKSRNGKQVASVSSK